MAEDSLKFLPPTWSASHSLTSYHPSSFLVSWQHGFISSSTIEKKRTVFFHKPNQKSIPSRTMVIFSSHPSDFGDTPQKKKRPWHQASDGQREPQRFCVHTFSGSLAMPDVEGILWTPFMTIKKGGHEGITQHDVRKHPWRLSKNNTSKVSPGWVAPALTKEKKRKRSSLWDDVMMPWWWALSTCLSVRSFRGSQPSHFIELPHPHLCFHLSSLELNPCLFQALCFRTNPFCGVQKFWLRWDSPTERYPRRCISQEDPTPWAHEWQIKSWHCLDVLWRHLGPCYIVPEYNRIKLCSRPSESVMQTVFGRP